MKTESYFGHVGEENGGYHIAVCGNCLTTVFMTVKQRDRLGIGVLPYLAQVVDCCKAPDYNFSHVVPFANIKRYCSACGQEIDTKEDC